MFVYGRLQAAAKSNVRSPNYRQFAATTVQHQCSNKFTASPVALNPQRDSKISNRCSRQITRVSSVYSQWEPSIFDPPQNRRPLTDRRKKLSQVITSTTSTAVLNLVEIPPWGASWQIREI